MKRQGLANIDEQNNSFILSSEKRQCSAKQYTTRTPAVYILPIIRVVYPEPVPITIIHSATNARFRFAVFFCATAMAVAHAYARSCTPRCCSSRARSHGHICIVGAELVCLTSLVLLLLGPFDALMANHPKRQNKTNGTRCQGHQVGSAVAVQSVVANALPVWSKHRVLIVDFAVEDVEDVARDNGRKCHEAPVLAEAMDAESLSDDGGKHSKEEPVRDAGQTRDKPQKMRVDDVEGDNLGDEKDSAGGNETPDSTSIEYLDDEIRPNT